MTPTDQSRFFADNRERPVTLRKTGLAKKYLTNFLIVKPKSGESQNSQWLDVDCKIFRVTEFMLKLSF